MKIEQHYVKNIPVLELAGRFDALTYGHFSERLNSVIDSGASHVCVNCGAVEFISSSALRVLLAGLKKVRKKQGSIALAAVPDHIREVFDMSGFLELFTIHHSNEDAVMVLQNNDY